MDHPGIARRQLLELRREDAGGRRGGVHGRMTRGRSRRVEERLRFGDLRRHGERISLTIAIKWVNNRGYTKYVQKHD